MSHNLRRSLVLVMSAAFLGACGDSGTAPEVPVASVAVQGPPTVPVGESVQLSVEARDANGRVISGRPATWNSSNAAVASVASTGTVTGLSVGSASIVATIGTVSGTASITVTPPPVAAVSLSPSPVTMLGVGATTQMTATLRDAAGNILTGRTVTWSAATSAVASVSSSGMVTAVGPGATRITATSEGRFAATDVTVPQPMQSPFGAISITQVELDSREPSGCVGGAACYGPSSAADVFVRVRHLALDRPTGLSGAEFSSLFNLATISGNGVTARRPSIIASSVTSGRFYLVFVVPRTSTTTPMQLGWSGNAPVEIRPSPGTDGMRAASRSESYPHAMSAVASRAPIVERW